MSRTSSVRDELFRTGSDEVSMTVVSPDGCGATVGCSVVVMLLMLMVTIVVLLLVVIRAGNSLIGFLSDSLVFCKKMSE